MGSVAEFKFCEVFWAEADFASHCKGYVPSKFNGTLNKKVLRREESAGPSAILCSGL
jgi:hypothetical protein